MFLLCGFRKKRNVVEYDRGDDFGQEVNAFFEKLKLEKARRDETKVKLQKRVAPRKRLTLLTIDTDSLGKIMEHVDFKSILTFRKVCRDLRNFIGNQKPDGQLNSIEITSAHNLEVNYIGPNWPSNRLIYRRTETGCEIEFNHYRKPILENTIPFWRFLNDLKLNISYQKTELSYLYIGLDRCRTVNDDTFFKGIKEVLTARPSKLKVVELDLTVTDQEHALSVLPYLDPKSLVDLTLSCRMNHLDIQELVKLDQWKNLKNLDMDRMFTSVSVEHFVHINTVMIKMKSISVEEVKILKEAFFSRPDFKSFRIDSNGISDLPKIKTFLGPTSSIDNADKPEKKWLFRIPGRPDDLFYIEIHAPFGPFRRQFPPYIKCEKWRAHATFEKCYTIY